MSESVDSNENSRPSTSQSLLSYFPIRQRAGNEPSASRESDESDFTCGIVETEGQVSDLEGITFEPHQPQDIMFPPIKFGVQSHSFQRGWFGKWKWLDWDDRNDCVYCHPCRMSTKLSFMLCKKAEPAFSQSGFRNWKDATRCFRKHENSHSHKEACLKWAHYTRSQSVAFQLSSQVQKDQVIAQKCLLKLISSLRFLARQGLAVRGHDEAQGNFLQLLHLRCEDSEELHDWMMKRGNWISHDVQNEILQLMAHFVLRKVIGAVKLSSFFTLIVDEATDVSFKEQVSICLRYVSDDMSETHESFLGLYETAETLTCLINEKH